MPNLFHFAKGLPAQTDNLAYGVKSATTFRVTSSFQMAGTETAYAMLPYCTASTANRCKQGKSYS